MWDKTPGFVRLKSHLLTISDVQFSNLQHFMVKAPFLWTNPELVDRSDQVPLQYHLISIGFSWLKIIDLKSTGVSWCLGTNVIRPWVLCWPICEPYTESPSFTIDRVTERRPNPKLPLPMQVPFKGYKRCRLPQKWLDFGQALARSRSDTDPIPLHCDSNRWDLWMCIPLQIRNWKQITWFDPQMISRFQALSFMGLGQRCRHARCYCQYRTKSTKSVECLKFWIETGFVQKVRGKNCKTWLFILFLCKIDIPTGNQKWQRKSAHL